MKINEFEKARDYLKKIVEDIDYVNISLKIPNQSLTVLLHSKCMIAQSKRIQLSLDVHEDEFDQIVPTDLIRILSNLIDNAFDAALLMPVKQRKVDIKLHRKSDAYVFEIANSGPTISKQDQEKLFESGFSTKNESNAGRGYGLTIVKQLVSVYQGRIEITSENRWTVFRVVTPLAKEHRT